MSKSMRAKFQVVSVQPAVPNGEYAGSEIVRFTAVSKSDGYPADGSDEDNTFAKFSPSANCEIQIANPALHGVYKTGQKFYVDFTPVAEGK